MNYDLTDKEIELDNWFFNLPACTQMDITGIFIDEDKATDLAYEQFDDFVADWWNSHDYNEKLMIYKNELRLNNQGK